MPESGRIFFFRLTSVELAVLLFGMMLGATALGAVLGRRVRHHSEALKEPFGVLQAALLGVVGLLLAFGLSLAVSRYQDRRANVVTEANAIGTAYLRAQTIAEPERSRSLDLIVRHTRATLRISENVPGSDTEHVAVARENAVQRQLWALAGRSLARAPAGSAPRLYVESLNDMFDDENARVVALSNRIPTAVLVLEILGSAFALGMLAAYLAILGQGEVAVVLASLLVAFLLFVTADLDRPTRGLIRIPDDPLAAELTSMTLPPAADAPRPPP